MSVDEETLKAAHSHSTYNKQEVLKSEMCGCFYCLSVFLPDKIEEWIDQDAKHETALCPVCAIDSVIGSNSGYNVTDKIFLHAMHKHYFQ